MTTPTVSTTAVTHQGQLEARALRMLHAGDDAKTVVQAVGLPIEQVRQLAADMPRPARAPIAPQRPAATTPVPAGQHEVQPPAPMPAGGSHGQLLEQAAGHSVAKVRKAAERIEKQLTDLRTLIADLAANETRRKAEAAARDAATAEVKRLEAALADARAKAGLTKKAPSDKPKRTYNLSPEGYEARRQRAMAMNAERAEKKAQQAATTTSDDGTAAAG